jgi:carbonic anhydrase/acetyltransferase-like protein (isoleucine patch superfamily)
MNSEKRPSVRVDNEFHPERVDPTAFIVPGAVVIGDVTLGPQSSVWFNAVLRGDVAPIRLGSCTNVQDGAVLHADEGFPCTLGDRVTVGHNAIVHGCRIEDNVMVGMGSVVMNGALVGQNSIIGVGAVVTEGTRIPPGSVVLGVPAEVKRAVEDRDRERITRAAAHYVEYARHYAGEA